MDLALLRSFLTVADLKSFSQAASRLNLTQSTVSHQIARLEAQLGKQLLTRTTRACEMTSDGQLLLDYSARILSLVDEMRRSLQPRLLTGTVVVGIPDDRHLFDPIAQALSTFMGVHPRVSLEIRAGLSADLLRELKAKKIDLAVIREIAPKNTSDIIAFENLAWVAARTWTPPTDGILSLALVAGGCKYRETARAVLDKAGVPWRCMVTCTSLEGVLRVVEKGLAISVVSEFDVPPGLRPLEHGDIVPVLPVSALRLRLAPGERSPSVTRLARMLRAVLRSDRIGTMSEGREMGSEEIEPRRVVPKRVPSSRRSSRSKRSQRAANDRDQ